MRQHLHLLIAVVHPAEHHVLEHHLAMRAPHVPGTRREHLVERIRAIQGHEPVAQLIGGGVQAYRQVELQRLRGEALDARHHSHGRHRDGTRRQAKSRFVVE